MHVHIVANIVQDMMIVFILKPLILVPKAQLYTCTYGQLYYHCMRVLTS